ncbi:glycosyltransferase family 39 protein [Acidobacteriota bacterium]
MIKFVMIQNARVNKTRIYKIFIAAIFIMGFYIRLVGYFETSFSHDESWRVIDMISGTYASDAAPNPVGYMWLGNLLTRVYNTEWVLRLSSLIPAFLSIWLFFLLAGKIFKEPLIRLIALFFFTFNTYTITFAKILKPYSLDIFFSLLILNLALSVKNRKKRALPILLFVTTVSSLFSMNAIFVYPGIFLLLFYEFFFKEKDKKKVPAVTLIAILVIVSIFFQYRLFWSKSDKKSLDYYWIERGAFYTEAVSPNINYPFWIVSKTKDMVIPFSLNEISEKIPDFVKLPIEWIIFLLFFISVLFFYKRRKPMLFIVFITPLIIVVFFNLLSVWPLGNYRVNIFLIPMIIVLLMVSVDNLVVNCRRVKGALVGGFAFLILLLLQLPSYTGNLKRAVPVEMPIPQIMEIIHEKHAAGIKDPSMGFEKIDICLSKRSEPAWMYYTKHHLPSLKKYKNFFADYFDTYVYKSRSAGYVEKETRRILRERPGKNTWWIFAHTYLDEKNALIKILAKIEETEAKLFHIPGTEIPGALIIFKKSGIGTGKD